jgi:hypothetical protein
VDAGIYTWMPAGICGWMLWPPRRGIYPQMPGHQIAGRLL